MHLSCYYEQGGCQQVSREGRIPYNFNKISVSGAGFLALLARMSILQDYSGGTSFGQVRNDGEKKCFVRAC